jgi:hypothetical protein
VWGWLKPVLDWLASWLEAKARQPDTLEDANTPPDLRRRWAAYLRDRLRKPNDGD